MRVSNYIIVADLPESRYKLLLHGYTGALDKVDAPLAEFLRDRRGCSIDDGDSASVLTPAVIDSLEKRGYLTRLSQDEERNLLVRLATAIHSKNLHDFFPSFMFIPSYRCNLRCPYCFQPHSMHAGSGPFRAVLETTQVDAGFKIIDSLHRQGAIAQVLGLESPALERPSAEKNPLELTLFGGEPLTEWTQQVVSYIVACTRERGGTVSAVTNGVELDRFRELLGPDGIAWLQITLDGTEAFHDRQRVGPCFRKTFQRIAKNIDLALQRGSTVTVRTNVDENNLGELEALDRYFDEVGWNNNPNFSANAAVVTGEVQRKGLIDRLRLTRVTMQLAEQTGSRIDSYERYARDILRKCLIESSYPFGKAVNCSAEAGLLIFDPMGDVYSCWEDVGNARERVGTFGADGLQVDQTNLKRWLTRFPGAIEECSECPYALAHSSGCAKRARDLGGSMAHPDCDLFQELFPESLARIYSEFERRLMSNPNSCESVLRPRTTKEVEYV